MAEPIKRLCAKCGHFDEYTHNVRGQIVCEVCRDADASYWRARVAELEAALRGLLPYAAAHHDSRFMFVCDHDEECVCDAEAQSSVALEAARAALRGDGDGGHDE